MRIKGILKAAAVMAAAVMCMSGCGNAEKETVQTETIAVSESETEKLPETPEEFHAAMVKRSLYSLGNTERLNAKIKQAQSGGKTTIAYIGGSITEGLTAGAENCYAKLSYIFFAEKYGSANTEYVNAGLSGTPSNLGVLRLERDVLAYEPDIVFVEFAVNDGQDKIAKESYESLVKTVLMQENQPAVVLIMNRIENGYTAQAHMKEIADFYSLPVISVADALTPEFDEGRMVWDDYSDDGSHPNVQGHKLICEFIENLYIQTENNPSEQNYLVKQGGKFGTPYENAAMITPVLTDDENMKLIETGSFDPVSGGTAGFTEAWKHNGGSEPIKLSVNANAFFVIYKRNSSGMGKFDVYINGEKLSTVNTTQADGWGEAFSEQIIKFQSPKDMEIEIHPSADSSGSIEILGFAYSQNTAF